MAKGTIKGALVGFGIFAAAAGAAGCAGDFAEELEISEVVQREADSAETFEQAESAAEEVAPGISREKFDALMKEYTETRSKEMEGGNKNVAEMIARYVCEKGTARDNGFTIFVRGVNADEHGVVEDYIIDCDNFGGRDMPFYHGLTIMGITRGMPTLFVHDHGTDGNLYDNKVADAHAESGIGDFEGFVLPPGSIESRYNIGGRYHAGKDGEHRNMYRFVTQNKYREILRDVLDAVNARREAEGDKTVKFEKMLGDPFEWGDNGGPKERF